MANQFRAPLIAPLAVRRPYLQVDPVPNLPTTFFPKTVPFTARAEFPGTFPPRRYAQDYQQGSIQNLGLPVTPGTVVEFRAPYIVPIFSRPRLQPDQTPNTTATVLKLAAAALPIIPPQFPDASPRVAQRDFMVFESLSYLPGPVTAPYLPLEWPTPQRARANPQDFSYQGTLNLPTVPFSQDDWPHSIIARRLPEGFEWPGFDTRGIPSGVAIPFDQTDWPITYPRKLAQADSYPSQTWLLKTIVANPFSQNHHPNPYPRRTLREDWIWSGTTTRGITPVQPASGPFATVYLEGYSVGTDTVLMRWTASSGAVGYRVYLNGVPQATVLAVRYAIITGLQLDTDYEFHVVVVNAFGVDSSILSNPFLSRIGSNTLGQIQLLPWLNAGTLVSTPIFALKTESGQLLLTESGQTLQ